MRDRDRPGRKSLRGPVRYGHVIAEVPLVKEDHRVVSRAAPHGGEALFNGLRGIFFSLPPEDPDRILKSRIRRRERLPEIIPPKEFPELLRKIAAHHPVLVHEPPPHGRRLEVARADTPLDIGLGREDDRRIPQGILFGELARKKKFVGASPHIFFYFTGNMHRLHLQRGHI